MDENEPPQLWSTARKWQKFSALKLPKQNVLAQFPYDISRNARGVSRLSCMS